MVCDSDDNATYSINSSNEDENMMQSTSQKLISVQENLRRENSSNNNFIIEEELSSLDSQVKLTEVTGPEDRQENHEEENLLEDNSQLEQITPFQIKNQTNNVIQVV